MYSLLIAFQDPSNTFAMGCYSSEAIALSEAGKYRRAARELFSVPCIVAVQFAAG